MFFSMDLYISFVEHRNDVCIGCAFSFPFWSFMDVKRLCTPDGVIFFLEHNGLVLLVVCSGIFLRV